MMGTWSSSGPRVVRSADFLAHLQEDELELSCWAMRVVSRTFPSICQPLVPGIASSVHARLWRAGRVELQVRGLWCG